MPSVTNIKSISYLKSHAAQISKDLQLNGNPFVSAQRTPLVKSGIFKEHGVH